MPDANLALYCGYVVFFVLVWFLLVFKDFKQDVKNYLLISSLTVLALFILEAGFLIVTNTYDYYLPLQIPFLHWPLSVIPLQFIYGSLVFRCSRFAKTRTQFLGYSFLFGALFGFMFESSGTALGFWEYTSQTGLEWYDSILAVTMVNVPLLAVIAEGFFFVILMYAMMLIQKDFVGYKQ